MKKKYFFSSVALLSPTLIFAADFSTIEDSIDSIFDILGSLIPLIISIGLILFLIGVVKFVTAGGDEEKRASARGMIIFGIIALFIMTAVWGFVNILQASIFGDSDSQILEAPSFPTVPVNQ